ncbi:c-type cytochrome biogenesis protein CcsB [Candidatus Pandoraea novymonadis]|uniref:Cytochrome c biogenesis protein CcsA n=1 Tax=Candidatus Pandoraea novymonadis TaxID=1808959 RepID=A0ABX5FEH3_9BURK|nr:c-type cytochrome biogenesis protein CcsB [Candidatus Pandoraea novymonadis]PSB91552.1 Cytochrome c biogenesis protein CcsA [Candidatus Pandoraea novymonadis]
MRFSESYHNTSCLQRHTLGDWMFAVALIVGGGFSLNYYKHFMNGYEQIILIFKVYGCILLGWHWPASRFLVAAVAALSLLSIGLYQADLGRADQIFLLKYLLSSQSAILWMSTLFFLSTLFFWGGLLRSSSVGEDIGVMLCWAAVLFGFVGMMVRWYESYLVGVDVGHIPISNLYEVFVLFCLVTALFYLYYERRYKIRQVGPFVLFLISVSVSFLVWYSVGRGAYEIQPLLPALQSWWMKIHVPANFIGYGAFSFAGMAAVAYLIKAREQKKLLISGASLDCGFFSSRLPSLVSLDDVIYKAITVGFSFFTIATILGALWAADAWGGYWSWDPKETWALIVWLNYAAWLHMRLIKGLRGVVLAWWALMALLVTTFSFLGVNMFLSGLHSYGQL